MKKGLLLFCAVLCAALVMFSCTPVSDCGRVATVKDEFGKSTLTFSVAGMNQSGRTVLPNDWTDTRAAALTYKLTGSKTQGGANVITENNTYTYAELKTNAARIDLEPAVWYLTLTAYQGENGPVVMKSVEAAVDLTQGNATKQFTLVAVRENTDATGDFKVTVKFPKPEHFAKVNVGLYTTGAESAPLVTGVTAETIAAEDLTTVDAANNLYSFVFDLDDVPVGTWHFNATFLDDYEDAETEGDDNRLIAFYSVPVIIDGGNLSEDTITLNDMFRKPPVAPSAIAVSYVFEDNAMNPVLLQNNVTTPTTYDAVVTWHDNSTNETGFEITVTETGVETPTVYTVDAGAESKTVELTTGKVYGIKVRAVNGYSPATELATAYTVLSNVNLFTVTYDLDGGKVRTDNDTTTGPQYHKYVVPYTKPTAAIQLINASGYPRVENNSTTFNGWFDNDNHAVTEIAAGNTVNITVKAKWSSSLTTTVVFPSYEGMGQLVSGNMIHVTVGNEVEISAASLTNVLWTLTRSGHSEFEAITSTDTTFTWDTDGVTPDTYNLTVSGTSGGVTQGDTIYIIVDNTTSSSSSN